VFQVPDVDNIPDLHGNPAGADLVLLIGGNHIPPQEFHCRIENRLCAV
jgi:hypothetical protein